MAGRAGLGETIELIETKNLKSLLEATTFNPKFTWRKVASMMVWGTSKRKAIF